jgi:hypothetical protein
MTERASAHDGGAGGRLASIALALLAFCSCGGAVVAAGPSGLDAGADAETSSHPDASSEASITSQGVDASDDATLPDATPPAEASIDTGTVDAATVDTGEGGADACVPSTCSAIGAMCGFLPDGCLGFVNCGACTDPSLPLCEDGTCMPNPCTPNPCAANQCGQVPDGCGATRTCPACPSGETCDDATNTCQ